MNNQICDVSFVSTYFGDCAWKLNLARAAFICVDRHVFFVILSSTFHATLRKKNYKNKNSYLSLLFFRWKIHLWRYVICIGKKSKIWDMIYWPIYPISIAGVANSGCNYWVFLQLWAHLLYILGWRMWWLCEGPLIILFFFKLTD